MARTMVVLCDVHLEQGESVRGEELPPITIDGKEPRVLALCDEHKRDYYDPFLELVDDLGVDAEEVEDKVVDQTPPPDKAVQDDEGQEQDESDQDDEKPAREDPDEAIAKSPAMSEVPNKPETARWDCPMDGCDKSYQASGENRAEDLKRLGNLHLSTAHDLDKSARQELLSA